MKNYIETFKIFWSVLLIMFLCQETILLFANHFTSIYLQLSVVIQIILIFIIIIYIRKNIKI